MLSLAILGMVLAGVFTAASQSMAQLSLAQRNLSDSEMARALIEEYLVTFPAMASSGTYQETWQWQMKEEPANGLSLTTENETIKFVKITAAVERLNFAQTRPFSLSVITARRANN